MRNMKCNNFTLVEILLALGVVVIGICSIMVLFPVGANATRDASMETYAANSVEELLNGLKYKLLNGEWDDYVGATGSIPELGTTDVIEDNFAGTKENFEDLTKSSDWEEVNINTKSGFYKYKDEGNVFQLVSYKDTSKELGEDKVDFRAIARLAKSKVLIAVSATGSTSGTAYTIDYDKAACIHVEVSWPAEAPFEARQKSYYLMEVFKENQDF